MHCRKIIDMNGGILWPLAHFPSKGKFVWVRNNSQPIRWSYLPEGATRFDVEREFRSGYLWNKAIPCQATIMKDGKMLDYWRFTAEPTAEMHFLAENLATALAP
jgi:hypothetical protein